MIVAQLYDRFIDLTVNFTQQTNTTTVVSNPQQTTMKRTYSEHRTLGIKCPRSGMKPSIALTYKRVPQDFCYQATLTISNLILPIPPQWVDDFDIVLGYLSGEGKEYSCKLKFTVFSSYAPEPGPDGTTVFECIVGGAKAALLTDRHFKLKLFNNNEITGKPWKIREVLDKSMQEAGLHPTYRMRDKDADLPFAIADIPSITFKSTYQLINWLQQQVNARLKSTKCVVTTAIFNDEVFFIEVDENGKVIDNKALQTTQVIPELDIVESVEWNSGILTVIAPFAPQVTPGSVFKINPSYYKASIGLPNTVSRVGGQKAKRDFYTVVTQQVSFSTDAENRMTLTAVPVKDAAINNQEAEETKKTFEQLKKELIDVTPIDFNGSVNPKQVEAQKEYKNLDDLYVPTNNFGGQTYYKIGDTDHKVIDAGGISSIAVYKDLPELKGKLKHGDKKGVKVRASVAWIPYILLLTNSHYKELKNANAWQADKWRIKVEAPDNLTSGNWLIIPNQAWAEVLSSPNLTQLLSAYDICADYYVKKSEPSYAEELRRAKQILVTGELE